MIWGCSSDGMDGLYRVFRKKRKWDQPAEFLPAAGLPFPIIIGNSVPVKTAPILPNLFVSNGVTTSQVLPLSGVMLQTAPALPKSNQVSLSTKHLWDSLSFFSEDILSCLI